MKHKVCLIFLILTIGLIFTEQQLKAQKVKIETTSLEILNNKLLIDYRFVKSKSTHRYSVWVEITKSTGEKINANALSGDIGDNVTGGENKQIIWDYNKDGIILNDEINVEVFANITVLGPGMGKAMLLSAVLPGLGLTAIDKGKPYWLMGVAAYGLLGGSVFLNHQAVQQYNDYLDESTDPLLSQDLLSQAQGSEQLSKTLGYSALGVWLGSMVWTALKAKSNNTTTIGLNKKQKLFLYGGINPYTKTKGFTLKYRF